MNVKLIPWLKIRRKGKLTMKRNTFTFLPLFLAVIIFFGLVSSVSAEAIEAVVVEIQK